VNLDGQAKFPMDAETLWERLMDAKVLQACIPGCQEFEAASADRYRVLLKLGVASIAGTYEGKVEITEKCFPSTYVLQITGSGGPGHVSALARVHLNPGGEDHSTLMEYHAQIDVGGTIASVGQRVLGGIAKLLVNQVIEKLKKEIRATSA